MAQRDLDVSLPSLRMHALEEGPPDGPLVVLLHGFPEFSESWQDVLPLLAREGFRAVAPDLRGYGKTERPRSGYDIDTLASDIAQLIERLSPTGRAHLVGHDWGGAIAYHVAAMHPERVDRLAVVNCPHPSVMARRIWRPGQLRRSWYMFFFQVPLLPEFALSRGGGALVPRMIRSAMVDRSRMTPDRARLYAQNLADRGAARAAVSYYRAMFRGLLSPSGVRRLLARYPKIRAPFRLVWGTEDVALGRELTVDLEPYFEHPPVVDYLDGVGHFSTIEAPERVAKSLLAHLRSSAVTKPSASRASGPGAS